MKRILQGLGFATLLALVVSAGPAHAQTTAATRTSTIPLRYDVSKEVTLNATVQSLPAKSGHGLTPTSPLMLQTTSGTVQGSLTTFALNGKSAVPITRGALVQVTGVMKTMRNNKQLFLIRTIQIGGRTYAIRNEFGFPLEHPAGNTSTTTQSKGGQL
jgi:DNA/RNA endonuclease YhcR with UshA esterase domain